MRTFILSSLLLSSTVVWAQDRIAQPVTYQTHDSTNSNSARDAGFSAFQQMLKFMNNTGQNDRYYNFDSNSNSSMQAPSFSWFGSAPFEQTAKECGEKAQRECSPSNFGGRTMCGYSVAQMMKCMANSINANNSASCTGRCGNGKDFVNCSSGQMQACGYEKVIPANSEKCAMPGAILAYTQSPTTRGQIYGHVEMVCGRQQYCSVYDQPHNQPWPRPVADACWYPNTSSTSGS